MSLKELVMEYDAVPSGPGREAIMERLEVLMPAKNRDFARVMNIADMISALQELTDAYHASQSLEMRHRIGKHLGKRTVDVYADAMEDVSYDPNTGTLKRIYWHAKLERHREAAGRKLGYSGIRIFFHQCLVEGLIKWENCRSMDELLAGWNRHAMPDEYPKEKSEK